MLQSRAALSPAWFGQAPPPRSPSSGRVMRYSAAITLLDSPSRAYRARASFFSRAENQSHSGFSPSRTQCSFA